MKTDTSQLIQINQWVVNSDTGEIFEHAENGALLNTNERIDPLGVSLLNALAERPGELVAKDDLLAILWPNTVVTEDALARCVSRVRKALNDNPRHPEIIETLPKRGYRLVAKNSQYQQTLSQKDKAQPKSMMRYAVIGTVLFAVIVVFIITSNDLSTTLTASAPSDTALNDTSNNTSDSNAFERSNGTAPHLVSLLRQADDYYHKVTRVDNEMALELYEQALAIAPNSADAHAGLANTLVQRAIRMPLSQNDIDWQTMSLAHALADKRLQLESNTHTLERASTLANRAISLAPQSARAFKAQGFVLSAQNKLDMALSSYRKALSINPNAWDVLINMGELYEITGQLTDAITYYKQALDVMNSKAVNSKAMNTKGEMASNHGRAWRATLGVLIAEKYLLQNNLNEAEIWFRHVLSFAPFDKAATLGLIEVLSKTSRINEVSQLCRAYEMRIGEAVCPQTPPDNS